MNDKFRRKWIKLINTASEEKCRLFLRRMRRSKKLSAHKSEVKFDPFTSEQKFVFMLLKERLELIAAENNRDNKVIKLPRADYEDMNWKMMKTKRQIDQEISIQMNKNKRKK